MKFFIRKVAIGCLPLTLIILFGGCEKFLNEKSDISLSIPESFKDLRAMMNNGGQLISSFPSLIEGGSDDYYVKESLLKGRPEREQFVYTWTIHSERSDLSSWNRMYNTVLIANTVLEGLDRINDGSEYERTILKGEAKFVRALAFYYLSQMFCFPYDPERKGELLGIPLRTSSDFADEFERSTMEETYDFIISELTESITHLPESVQYKSSPSKSACYALLARLYLIMGDYENANKQADFALGLNDSLLDYNTLDPNLSFPIPIANEEIIYYGVGANGYLLNNNRAFIPRYIFDFYEEDDLRKKIFFFNGAGSDIAFKGNYTGRNSIYFGGFATDELYLIRAECEIRLGNVDAGLDFLNNLLVKRYEKDSFSFFSDLDRSTALDIVLSERRKELIKRGIRWTDLRRLLREPNKVSTLFRKSDNGIDDAPYKLEPEPKNYTYPIPSGVTDIHPYEQNPL